MADFSTIACEEIHNSRSEQGSETGLEASVQLRCTWGNRLTLADDLISNRRPWPSFTAAKCFSASITPDGADYTTAGQECVYTHAIVSANYSTLAQRDLISESIEPVANFRTLDHRLFRWNGGAGVPLNEQEAPGQLIRSFNLVRTMYNIPAVPATILSLPGCCNSAVYSSALLGLSFAAETLLFGLKPLTRTITTGGTTGFTVTTSFSFQPNGWNRFWNQRANAYQFIHLAGSGTPYKPYPPAAFSDWLF